MHFRPTEREETERVIRSALKEIMMSVDLDEVTSKYIRGRLEEYLDMDLGEFKSFIDQEMITILGQMDAPTEIFEHVYLGSEWNASNLEELQRNGLVWIFEFLILILMFSSHFHSRVHHILNVTREIDNFFPGLFDYCNVRVYDDEKTDLLKHWDNTFKYISRAKMEGSKVLVHCKMGISRSASVVIAYAMKEYNWNFSHALKHVKEKRTCIKPNKSFISQLETYQGILDAMKNKEKLQRSKSETNLKSSCSTKDARLLAGSEPTPLIQAINGYKNRLHLNVSGKELKNYGKRPKSWSPEIKKEERIIALANKQQSLTSLENLTNQQHQPTAVELLHQQQRLKQNELIALDQQSPELEVEDNRQNSKQDLQQTTKTMLTCNNGQNYSVSANQIVHLQREIFKSGSSEVPSVKLIITELNKKDINQNNTRSTKDERKNLNTNLTATSLTQNCELWDPGDSLTADGKCVTANCLNNDYSASESANPTITTATALKFISNTSKILSNNNHNNINNINNNNSGNKENNNNNNSNTSEQNDGPVWTSSAQIIHQTSNITVPPSTTQRKEGDPFSAQLDKVFEREERKHNRLSNSMNLQQPLVPPIIAELSSSDNNVSRQDSCSSIDSAIVLSYPGDHVNLVSRHSSWGSGDNRTIPSRNSSWGSYDMKTINQLNNPSPPVQQQQNQTQNQSLSQQMSDVDEIVMGQSGIFPYDKDEIPWHPGTVKRTKQKIEEKTTNKRICCDIKTQQQQKPPIDFNQQTTPKLETKDNKLNLRCHSEEILTDALYTIQHPAVSSTSNSLAQSKLTGSNFKNNRLSASAPETFSIDFISTNELSSKLTQHGFLYNFHQPKQDEDERNISGIVRNLKMNFEAKAGINVSNNSSKKKGRSLPSSPVAMHADTHHMQHDQQHSLPEPVSQQQSQSVKSISDAITNENSFHKDALEDINVRGLVDKYEVTKMRTNNSLKLNRNSNKQNYSNIFNNRQQRPHSINITSMPISTTTSKPLMINHSTVLTRNDETRRPPVRPNNFTNNAISIKNAIGYAGVGGGLGHHHHHGQGVVVAGKKLNTKSEFSKTHPMTRLSLTKQPLNTTTYNTM